METYIGVTLPPLDYETLREAGIEHIQKLVGRLWTNHNPSDPGITILEQLCYAITDLSYRLEHPMEDLLATGDGSDPYQSLFSPAQILTTQPITLKDWRKLLIDIGGIKNAWVELDQDPQPSIYYSKQDRSLTFSKQSNEEAKTPLKGMYKVYLEQDELYDATGRDILKQAFAKLHKHRSLCEDFSSIELLGNQPVYLHLSLETDDDIEDINHLVGQVYYELDRVISPRIPFYDLQTLLDKSHSIDAIFEGPALGHGFIDDDELDRVQRKTQLRASDLIQVIMDVPGVTNIHSIKMGTGKSTLQDWILDLDPKKAPKFDIRSSQTRARQGTLLVKTNRNRIKEHYDELRRTKLDAPLSEHQRNVVLEKGRHRGLDRYHSVQNTFPQTYGIGEYGLPNSVSNKRKGQAKQLKGYLLFFEQVLANYLSQIAHCKDLFSFENPDNRTYFYQELRESVPDIAPILEEVYSDDLPTLVENEEGKLERKNRLLNHLLARFAEQMTEYSLMMYSLHSNDEWNTATTELIEAKKTLLKEYPTLSASRGKGLDYTKDAWTSNVTGLEQNIRRLLGIPGSRRSDFTNGQEEGFHILEHILLSPRGRLLSRDDHTGNFLTFGKGISSFAQSKSSGKVTCTALDHGLNNGDFIEIYGSHYYTGVYPISNVSENTFDILSSYKKDDVQNAGAGSWIPYNQHPDIFSFQISFVFPDYIGRFQNQNFRDFVAQTIRSATPAHLHVHLHWLSEQKMLACEQSYKALLNALSTKQIHLPYALELISLLDLGTIGIPYNLPQNSLTFDGEDNYVKIPHSDQLGQIMGANSSFTLSLWFRVPRTHPRVKSTTRVLISKRYTGDAEENKGFVLYLGTFGKPVFEWDMGSNQAVCWGNQDLRDGLWHHLAIIKNHSKVALYLDEKTLNGIQNQLIGASCLNDLPLYIGSSGKIGNNFQGKIAEVRLWQQALRPEEVQQRKNQFLQGNEVGLIAYWKLDDEASEVEPGNPPTPENPIQTQAKDSSTHANHGTIELFGKNVLPYAFNSSNPIPLDGIDDYIVFAPASDSTLSTFIGVEKSFTLSLWFKTDTAANEPRLIYKKQLGDTPKGLELYIAHKTKTVHVLLSNGVTEHTLKGSEIVDDNIWHHAALVVRPKKAILYLDGQLQNSVPIDQSSSGFDNISKWYIGGVPLRSGNFKGQIAEVRFWSKDHLKHSIESNRHKRLQSNEPGLIGYWKMDETKGTTVKDSSPSRLNGVRVLERTLLGIGSAQLGFENYIP